MLQPRPLKFLSLYVPTCVQENDGKMKFRPFTPVINVDKVTKAKITVVTVGKTSGNVRLLNYYVRVKMNYRGII